MVMPTFYHEMNYQLQL